MSATPNGDRRIWWVASALGATGVAFGAFGAHVLKGMEMEPRLLEIWQTAVLYHLIHAVACIGCAVGRRHLAAWVFLAGVILFSGSLYLYTLTQLHPLVYLTPLGGLTLIAGWFCLPFRRS